MKIQEQNATVKHPQTIGTLERNHATIKRLLEIHTNRKFSDWHRHLPLTTYVYNTTYHTSTSTTPTQVFHGREPIKPLNARFNGKRSGEHVKTLNTQQNMDQHLDIYEKAREKLIVDFQKDRGFYDRKAEVALLEKDDFWFLLHRKITKHNDIMAIGECKWLGLFKAVKKLTRATLELMGSMYWHCLAGKTVFPVQMAVRLKIPLIVWGMHQREEFAIGVG